MDRNKVDDLSFWKKRIDTAAKKQFSVYVCNDTSWKIIYDSHKKILKEKIPSDAKVLDAGCGYGRMADLFDKENYLGIDFSPDFIGLAKKEYPEYEFDVQSLQNLPYKDNEFDWAFCVSIKNMIKSYSTLDWDVMEKELKRVAKKVLILEYTSHNEYEIL